MVGLTWSLLNFLIGFRYLRWPYQSCQVIRTLSGLSRETLKVSLLLLLFSVPDFVFESKIIILQRLLVLSTRDKITSDNAKGDWLGLVACSIQSDWQIISYITLFHRYIRRDWYMLILILLKFHHMSDLQVVWIKYKIEWLVDLNLSNPSKFFCWRNIRITKFKQHIYVSWICKELQLVTYSTGYGV